MFSRRFASRFTSEKKSAERWASTAGAITLGAVALVWFGYEQTLRVNAHDGAITVMQVNSPAPPSTIVTVTSERKSPHKTPTSSTRLGTVLTLDDHSNIYWSKDAQRRYMAGINGAEHVDPDALAQKYVPDIKTSTPCTVVKIVDRDFGECRVLAGQYSGRTIIAAMPDAFSDITPPPISDVPVPNDTVAPSGPVQIGQTGIGSGLFAFSKSSMDLMGHALASNDRDGALEIAKEDGCILTGDHVIVTGYEDFGTVMVARVLDGHWKGHIVYGPREQVKHI